MGKYQSLLFPFLISLFSFHSMSHFARVLPIVGTELFDKKVAILGFPKAEAVVRYLAANGVRRWVWVGEDRLTLEILLNSLKAQHGAALPLEISLYSLPPRGVDVVVALGEAHWKEGERLAERWQIPLLNFPASMGWAWECTAPLVALQIRNHLLGQPLFEFPIDTAPSFVTPPARKGRVLIAGLGSLGSIAALHLSPYLNTLILADPDTIDPYNPVRQAFPLRMVGRNKAESMAELVWKEVPEVIALPYALDDEEQVVNIVQQYDITAALVVTGTHADYAIARGLQMAGVPHIVGRCYPRARYWEGIVVEAGTPTLEEIRGQLYLGPSPSPTPEQQRAYSDSGALEAEPATLIESGWAAVWLARLLWQLIQPPALRELWFLERMVVEETCFIGGLHVEATPQGMAYGIEQIGQMRGYRQELINQ
jgi:hypothetical protein